jgi:hypothetical protein
LEIAQGYFQVADHIAAAALRATEPDSIPDAEWYFLPMLRRAQE